MSRLSFRPRPLDIHKKLPIVKSLKEFEDDDASTPTTTTRNSQIQRLVFEAENEVHQINAKKAASEIPTPQFIIVDTYERDYSRSFSQPTTYVRARGARTELSEFVEYDLDNEDEDWLQEFNNERKIITPERLENILFKLEVLDHKTRERGGIITPLGSVVPVLLQLDAAAEVLQSQDMRYAVLQSIYSYWKAKRERWQKPILRRLQPPPPVNDTNPYNVFRPREKAHRLHTRRMQRRENNVQSFEKLRQVQRNLGQAKVLLEALIKREEKKREVFECEISIQRTHMKYKNEAQLIEDGLGLGGFSSYRQASSDDDDFVDSDDLENGYTYSHALAAHIPPMVDPVLATVRNVHAKREYKGRHPLQRKDPDEPIMLFAKPLDLEKLAAVGIVHPPDPPAENGGIVPPYQFSGRIGRGGRIVFDRWDPLSQVPIQHREELPRKAPAFPPG